MAALACTDRAAGFKARDLVKIEYEDLEPILEVKREYGEKDVLGFPYTFKRDQGITKGRKKMKVHEGTVMWLF